MTREEIREGIEKEIEDTLIVCGQNPLTAKALAMDTSLDIVNKLHTQDVVIKVDRELPDHLMEGQIACDKPTYQEILRRAGYEAVEPLIKE